jgi:hypothetical protein
MNCDGVLDLQDVSPFALALANPAGYAAAFPNCNILRGDMNLDVAVDGADVQLFVNTILAP